MRNASNRLALLIAVAALAACQNQSSEQNIAIENEAATPTNANTETLPADESSAVPSNELINGADDADVNAGNAAANGY